MKQQILSIKSPLCGYIEGYYGKMLSWDDRKSIITTLQSQSLNTYIYAPKEDPYHRQTWKIPYPQQWIIEFKKLIAFANTHKVCFIPSISPGLSYDYKNDSDYKILFGKFNDFVKAGATTVALLMDDIPEALPASCQKDFTSLGQAHALLLTKLQKDLQKKHAKISLWFCPTVYADSLAKEGVSNNLYLKDLAVGIPSDTIMLWTGPSVISKVLDKKGLRLISSMFKGNIVIWDNLYANDYCPYKLFVGTFSGRNHSMLQVARGICINPTGLPHTDMFLLSLLGSFAKNIPTNKAWKDSLFTSTFTNDFIKVSRFFTTPGKTVDTSSLSQKEIIAFRKALHQLIWFWKSPLQMEWYSYLFMLDVCLELCEKQQAKTLKQAWLNKKFPEVLSTILSSNLSCVENSVK